MEETKEKALCKIYLKKKKLSLNEKSPLLTIEKMGFLIFRNSTAL
jgi:hypothetical protein